MAEVSAGSHARPEAPVAPTEGGPIRARVGRPADAGRMRVLHVPIMLCPFTQAVERIREMLSSGRPHHVVLANAHTLNLASDDLAYRRVLQDADLVLRDGVGVELAARLAGRDAGHNFVGTDFIAELLAALGPAEVRVFLFGAAAGVAERAAHVLRRRAPNIRVVGTASGYGEFGPVVAQVRAARPHVLLVALGNPMQECWIDAHREELGVPVSIGVGALFDYLGGRMRRAPDWVLRLRGEWVFRLLIEPQRLWRRYVIGNPRFIWRVLRSNGGRQS